MGCCGKTKSVLKKGKHIAIGYTNLARGKKYEFTDSRVRLCQLCDDNTWLTLKEYANWLKQHGIEVLTNFTQLEKLSPLPKHSLDNKRRNLFCRLCKCFIPAKAKVENEKCLLNKWEK